MKGFSVVIVSSRGLENVSREKIFSETLLSLKRQSYPLDSFEVIVVDSGSNLGTDFFKSLTAGAPLNWRYIETGLGNVGPAKGRNIGIRSANFDWLAFTDDDSLVPENWLETFSKAYENFPDIAGVGGLTLPEEETAAKNFFARFEERLYLSYLKNSDFRSYLSASRDEHPVFSGNISYKKSVLLEVGLFDETFIPEVAGEDGDLKERVLQKGYHFLFVPSIVRHHPSYTFRRFYRQQLSRGASIQRFRKDHHLEAGRAGILLKIFISLFSLPIFLVTEGFDLSQGLLKWLSLILRNVGKLYYGRKV